MSHLKYFIRMFKFYFHILKNGILKIIDDFELSNKRLIEQEQSHFDIQVIFAVT